MTRLPKGPAIVTPGAMPLRAVPGEAKPSNPGPDSDGVSKGEIFQVLLKLDKHLLARIDRARSPASVPRVVWIREALVQRLEREGR